MAKSADAFRTISEVADWLDTPAHVLRFWESKFSQVKPVKRAGGRRYYRPQDMKLLGGIKKLLHDDGMTIKGVQKLLREEGIKHVVALSQPLAGEDTSPTPRSAPPEPQPAAPAQVLDFRRRDDATAPEAQPEPTPEPEAPVAETPAAPAPQEPEFTFPETETPEAETEAADVPETEVTDPPEPRAEPPADPEAEPAPKARIPAFLSRPPIGEEAATPAAEDEGAPPPPEPEASEPEAPEPRAPAPAPIRVDVPADPGDRDFAAPGLLTAIAELPRPFDRSLIDAVRPIVQRLRRVLDESDAG